MGEVVKAKVGELEEEAREVFLRQPRKDLTGVIQGVSGKKRFLARFQDGCEKGLKFNQLTTVTVDKIPVKKKPRRLGFLRNLMRQFLLRTDTIMVFLCY